MLFYEQFQQTLHCGRQHSSIILFGAAPSQDNVVDNSHLAIIVMNY